MEEDKDLHNNLKCDQVISDEQTTVDNAKISTLETSIPGENAKVSSVITEEIDTLEKDLLAESDISRWSRCGRELQRETVGGMSRGQQINVLGY